MANITISNSDGLTLSEKQFQEQEWKIADYEIFGKAYDRYDWDRHRTYFKAADDGKIIALLVLDREGGVGIIDELIVHREFRRQGIATMLIKAAEVYAKQHGSHKMTLETVDSLPAIYLYRKLGYSEETRLLNHYGKKTWVVMSKSI